MLTARKRPKDEFIDRTVKLERFKSDSLLPNKLPLRKMLCAESFILQKYSF